MPLAVDLVVVHAVRQIYQQLITGRAAETPRVPQDLVPELWRRHSHLALGQTLPAAGTAGGGRGVLNVT